MPKRSSYAIALGLHPRPMPPPERSLKPVDAASETRTAADSFYFRLETFLDSWRREGMGEEAVRAALKRAEAASLAMEAVGKRLKGL